MKMLITDNGFTKDTNNATLKTVLKNGNKIKEVYIDVYTEEPFMMLVRNTEKNVSILNDNARFIIQRNDRHKTQITNILFNEIEENVFKKISDCCYEFVFKINNVWCKLVLIV